MYADESVIEYIRPHIIKDLKRLSVKCSVKKLDYNLKSDITGVKKPFGANLESLVKEEVPLHCGSRVDVPVFLVDSIRYIERDVRVEGLFRKNGSALQKRNLKAMFDRGCRLDDKAEFSVINVGDILKEFLRQLREPLIPYRFQNTFLKCLTLKKQQREAIMLCCFLLPSTNLNSLAYLMQFLLNVSRHVENNRMGIENLAIVFTPNLMPIKTPIKLTHGNSENMSRAVRVVKVLIENAENIGIVPESICENMCDTDTESVTDENKRKKRSNSLTRVLGAFRRMVGRPQQPSSAEKKESRIYTPFRNIFTPNRNVPETSSRKRARIVPNDIIDYPETPIRFATTTMLTPRTMVAGLYTPQMAPRKSCLRPRRSVSFCETVKTSTPPDGSPKRDDLIQVPRQEFEAIKARLFRLENSQPEVAASNESKIKQLRNDRVVRSPSARKIGRMRKRESENNLIRDTDSRVPEFGTDVIEWQNSADFLAKCSPTSVQERPRDSVQLIVNMNAGNVLAKALMFDSKVGVPRSSLTSKDYSSARRPGRPLMTGSRPCSRIMRGSALPPLKGSRYLTKIRQNSSNAVSAVPRRSPRFVRPNQVTYNAPN